eukprot:gene15906-18903_t
MRLIIQNNSEEACEFIAQYLKKKISEFVPTDKKSYLVLGLPTGGSPLPIYKRLVAYHKAGELSFKNVVTFNMDEYLGLEASHPFSYHHFMWSNLFSHVDIVKENVHILNGMTTDTDAECAAYEAAIVAAGGIDLFLGGMGVDGHIAFNEPGSSLSSRTRVKTLTRDTIIVNSRFFQSIDQVPTRALTVGVGTIMDAREISMGEEAASLLVHTKIYLVMSIVFNCLLCICSFYFIFRRSRDITVVMAVASSLGALCAMGAILTFVKIPPTFDRDQGCSYPVLGCDRFQGTLSIPGTHAIYGPMAGFQVVLAQMGLLVIAALMCIFLAIKGEMTHRVFTMRNTMNSLINNDLQHFQKDLAIIPDDLDLSSQMLYYFQLQLIPNKTSSKSPQTYIQQYVLSVYPPAAPPQPQ